MNHLKRMICLMVVASTCTASALAAVSAEEAAQLGGAELTLFGAEKAGNKEGTIPPYTGVGVKAPPSWDPKNPGQRPDPYGEKPLFSITAQNAAQYVDKLDGMIELFKRYPNFRMDVYPTHRDFVFPKYVLDNTIKNAIACKAVDNELKLEGCYGGLPFPIPKTGNQAMWNHLVSYRTWTEAGRSENWVVPTSGEPVLVESGDFLENFPYYDPAKIGPHPADALYYRYLGKDEAPARMVGGKMLLLDSVNQLGNGRTVYVYMPGRRWTKLAAELNYDTPSPYAGGTATMDDSKVFMGALDRYDFKLLGKKEKYIYYDNFKLADHKACSSETFHSTKNFPNPDCVRWELHRVWVVQATLKPGSNHIYHKRIFYWDEDGFNAGQGENYDANGKLYRLSNNLFYPYFEAPGGFATSYMFMDLQTGIWSSAGVTSCPICGWRPILTPVSDLTFTPESMSGGGVR